MHAWSLSESSIGGKRGSQPEQINSGRSHSCAISSDRDAYCWGSNRNGQLGTDTAKDPCPDLLEGRPELCSTNPIRVSGGLKYAAISAGAGHTCALTTDGLAYCWGWNGAGQLGSATPTDWNTGGVGVPQVVSLPSR
jgi:alpha-tubulin suppressor-like RCC1 family protein